MYTLAPSFYRYTQMDMFRHYYSTQSPYDLLNKPGVMSVILWDGVCEAPKAAGIIYSGLSTLSAPVCEVIEYSGADVVRGVSGRCHWSRTEEICLAAIWIPPADLVDVECATEAAYAELTSYLADSGFAYPFRFWNFIPGINEGEGDAESYKKFCVGRLNAFNHANIRASAFPAASALGHHTKGAVIYALASKHRSVHYENPLQESAYHYPREYGPSSPSFARASKISVAGDEWVFISGTASILGHQTHSPGDVSQQLEVTLRNIECLVSHIVGGWVEPCMIRVYLRRAEHFDLCRSFLESRLSASAITYTLADICRSNLLVEIEASFAVDNKV